MELDGDARLIVYRAASFARELGAPGGLGRLLARRAAILSVRMDQSADRDLLLNAAAAQAAREDFDADRRAERIARLAAPRGSDRRVIAGALRNRPLSPEGLDHLIGTWSGLHGAIRTGGEAEAAAARDRAAL